MPRFIARHREYLTWPHVLLGLAVVAVLTALWLSNDVSAGWTVGNYR